MLWRAPRKRRVVDGVPGAFGLFFRHATVEISVLDMLGLPFLPVYRNTFAAFLVVGVMAFVTQGHGDVLPRQH